MCKNNSTSFAIRKIYIKSILILASKSEYHQEDENQIMLVWIYRKKNTLLHAVA